MKELERQQKEIYQVQKVSDDDDLMSVTSRSSLRTNGYEDELLGPSQYRKSSRNSTGSGETSQPSRGARKDEPMPSLLNCNSLPSRSQRVEERSDKDFGEKGSRPVSSLSAATLASLGGTSSRRGSGDTSISVDTEASIREIKVAAISYNDLFKGYKCNCTSITVTLIFVNPPQPSLQALYSPVPDTLGSCLCSFLGATDHHVTDSPLLVSCMQAYAKIHYHITMLCVLIQDFFCLHGSCDSRLSCTGDEWTGDRGSSIHKLKHRKHKEGA
ncbi:hypothetical protein AB205_0123980, partial [Aquarana catesbeiana]